MCLYYSRYYCEMKEMKEKDFSWKKTSQHQIKELKSHKIERIIWHDWKGDDALGIKSILGVKSLKNFKKLISQREIF